MSSHVYFDVSLRIKPHYALARDGKEALAKLILERYKQV